MVMYSEVVLVRHEDGRGSELVSPSWVKCVPGSILVLAVMLTDMPSYFNNSSTNVTDHQVFLRRWQSEILILWWVENGTSQCIAKADISKLAWEWGLCQPFWPPRLLTAALEWRRHDSKLIEAGYPDSNKQRSCSEAVHVAKTVCLYQCAEQCPLGTLSLPMQRRGQLCSLALSGNSNITT